jgi:hypothetical protein
VHLGEFYIFPVKGIVNTFPPYTKYFTTAEKKGKETMKVN